jgi:ATP-dependent Clp protease adapter protein ClpS
MPEVVDRPVGTITIEGVNLDSMSDYMVKAYNNEISTFQDVMGVMMSACGHDRDTAFRYTKKIHDSGSAVCYWNSKEKCEKVATAFGKIGVKAEVIENK